MKVFHSRKKFCCEVRFISFLKSHGKAVSNALVVLLVLLAVYEKTQSGGLDSLFQFTDLYIVVGAVLALVLLRVIGRRKG